MNTIVLKAALFRATITLPEIVRVLSTEHQIESQCWATYIDDSNDEFEIRVSTGDIDVSDDFEVFIREYTTGEIPVDFDYNDYDYIIFYR